MVDKIKADRIPVVYVSTWRKTMEVPPYGVFDVEGTISDYVIRMQNAGAVVLQVPRDVPQRAERVLRGADALVMIGGDDVDPSFYGQEDRGSGPTTPEADAFDLALVREAQRRRLPLFAICRGHQLLNVALGGTLHQDIAQAPIRHTPQDSGSGSPQTPEHTIRIDPESRYLSRVLGEVATVNSIHHQAVDDCAPGLRVVARSDDGIIEASEPLDPDWLVLSVQWHPEKMEDHQVLFDWFVTRLTDALLGKRAVGAVNTLSTEEE